MLALYRAAGSAATVFLAQNLRARAARGKEIPARLPERFGRASLPRPAGRLVWFHAASVGETLSILPVIAALEGEAQVLLTTGTVTSATLAAARLPEFARHQFAPLDVPAWVDAFLSHWHPDAAVFVESELWPGMLDECDARGIPRLLINARMSARSVRNWQRLGKAAGRVLRPFRYIHAQSAQDAAHLEILGASGVLAWGNLKFSAAELPVDDAALKAFMAQLPGPVWLAASTHAGEEAIILAAHARLLAGHPGLVTIIVPRHPERGAEIAKLCAAPRRSLGQAPAPGQPYIADTLGELGLFFRAAPFAFIGNSLVPGGGHNLIEPARLARPVITGPHVENFTEAAGALTACGALVLVRDAETLAAAAGAWLADPDAALAAGAAAASLGATAGLPDRLASLILSSTL